MDARQYMIVDLERRGERSMFITEQVAYIKTNCSGGWTVLIANLLRTVLSRMIKRHVSFSQIVTILRLTLMYYTNFIAFMEDPQKDESVIRAERAQSPPSKPSLFD